MLNLYFIKHIETLKEDPSIHNVEEYRNFTVRKLWNLTNHFNVLNKDRWTNEINRALYTHEVRMVKFIAEEGYDQMTAHERWSFSSALMFALR